MAKAPAKKTTRKRGKTTARPLILIGGGDHARVLIDLIQQLGHTILFASDNDPIRHGTSIAGVMVKGDDSLIKEYDLHKILLVNAVGSISRPVARRSVYATFKDLGYQFISLIHPHAIISPSSQMGEGVQVMAGAVIQAGVVLDDDVLVNTNTTVDHDCLIGKHVHVAPGVTLSGKVRIGDASHIGTGASVIQGIRIGTDAVVGAGSVVICDVPDHATVVGVPARVVNSSVMKCQSRHHTKIDEHAFTIMLSAAGRRVALLDIIQRTLSQMQLPAKVLATDISRASAAYHRADFSRIVPNYSDSHCLEELLAVCREYHVRLIVPTIDPDLPFFAEHRNAFEQIGARIMVSSLPTVEICHDKRVTHEWLVANKFPCLRQADARELLKNMGDWEFPLFVKPMNGASSIGATIVRDRTEFRIATAQRECIVQKIARGREYTVDVYVDRHGKCRCTVPRLRIETRGGEVSKGMTVRSRPIQILARRIAEALPEARGVLNIQMFYDEKSGALMVNEINPRFGGGYPLSHHAGATMAQWMLEEMMDLPITARENQWTNGLVMLRYDEAVFVSRGDAGVPWPLGRSEVGPLHALTSEPPEPRETHS